MNVAPGASVMLGSCATFWIDHVYVRVSDVCAATSKPPENAGVAVSSSAPAVMSVAASARPLSPLIYSLPVLFEEWVRAPPQVAASVPDANQSRRVAAPQGQDLRNVRAAARVPPTARRRSAAARRRTSRLSRPGRAPRPPGGRARAA